MENTLVIQNAEEYQDRGNRAMAAVEAIQVVDEASNVMMGDILAKIKLGVKTIEGRINEPIEKAHELHRWLTGIRTQILTPWRNAETLAKKRMGDYQYKLMVARREAEQKAAAERAALEAEQMRKAQKAIQQNKPEKAEAILAKPVETKTVVPEAPKTEKQSAVFEYSWEAENIDLVPREFLMLDTAKITAKVRKEKMDCKIPGIKVIESAGIRSRAA